MKPRMQRGWIKYLIPSRIAAHFNAAKLWKLLINHEQKWNNRSLLIPSLQSFERSPSSSAPLKRCAKKWKYVLSVGRAQSGRNRSNRGDKGPRWRKARDSKFSSATDLLGTSSDLESFLPQRVFSASASSIRDGYLNSKDYIYHRWSLSYRGGWSSTVSSFRKLFPRQILRNKHLESEFGGNWRDRSVF